jgi:hypothetical protein
MSISFNTKKNKWRLVLPLPQDGKRIEWFETEEKAEAARAKFFQEDPYGIHIRRLLHGTKAEQAAYRAELDEAERNEIEHNREGGLQPTRTYALQIDGVTLLNILTILTDAEAAYRKHGFDGMGQHAKEARTKILAAIEALTEGLLK